jgi:TPR repeat protein
LARELSKEEKPDLGKIYGHLLTAANAGSAIAQNELGLFYFSGKLGIADVSAAMSWFGRATQAGFADAQNNLATMHERGIGVPQNYENAAKLYGFAANQGHSDACAAMARLYANGNGLPLKPELAWAWATLAIEQGDKENAAKVLTKLNKSLTEEQLTAAKKELAAIKTPTTK